MRYIEIRCRVQPVAEGAEILTALLGEIGCDSFMEWEEGLLAYIPEKDFSESELKKISLPKESGIEWSYTVSRMEDKDWNAEWESHYEPVWIDRRCHIHAPFHDKAPEAEYDIVIEPKMSFGTAHHETPAQMISYLLEEPCSGKAVLDMGAGTGVLAILAWERGARPVTAIDIDEWAYNNMLENTQLNGADGIRCIMGDAGSIPDERYDIILANINRNILLQDMPCYVQHLNHGGTLMMSGFYEGGDWDAIRSRAESLGLEFSRIRSNNRWAAERFTLK
ncbi:MAG: 50S ribosomal protein L11 methyltransferase [Bacteroidales bacterium]|nr:50S ribosomal protein L11 methyltransferase [Bacteroidales bacterium]